MPHLHPLRVTDAYECVTDVCGIRNPGDSWCGISNPWDSWGFAQHPQSDANSDPWDPAASEAFSPSDYDVNFRQLRHTSPHLPWDNPHMQLYVDAFNNPAPSILAPKQSRPTPARDNKIPKGFCFRYHSPTEHCFVASCPFKHACPSCQGAHKAFLCPNRDYYDRCLPMGSSTSCSIFEAIKMFRQRYPHMDVHPTYVPPHLQPNVLIEQLTI
ncbi:hypothetical protein Bbelb_021010 [Branchiostoma belcheri]|nr:hypothetical protein Bbelb_021010 [Branchiostoma belcheri]